MSTPLETRTSTELLHALKDAGNAKAWSDFDGRFHPILLAVVMKMGLSRDDAADVAQTAMTQFFRDYQAGKYDRGKGRLRTWLISIAKNRAIDLMRKEQNRRGARGDSMLMVLPDDETVSGMWSEEEDRAVAKEALELLRTQTRVTEQNIRIFELVDVKSVPPEQAAKECGVTVDHVYKATNRCRRHFKEIVKDLRAKFDDGI